MWEIVAHEKEITGLSLSLSCPGLLVTSSDDGVIKVWDAIKPEILEPVWEKKTNLGALQCLAPCPDNPFVFVVGGDHKSHNYKVWNLLEVSAGKFLSKIFFIQLFISMLVTHIYQNFILFSF